MAVSAYHKVQTMGLRHIETVCGNAGVGNEYHHIAFLAQKGCILVDALHISALRHARRDVLGHERAQVGCDSDYSYPQPAPVYDRVGLDVLAEFKL